MYYVLAKQHCEAVTSFSSGYELFNNNGQYNTFIIAKCENQESAFSAFGQLLLEKFDADFDGVTFYINEEAVYNVGETRCIFNGIYLWVEYVETISAEWIELPKPLDSDIEIKVRSVDDVICEDDVICIDNDLYLMSLNNEDVFRLIDDNLIGRKVFWLDPSAWHSKEHTSSWKTITEITSDCTLLLDNATEAYFSECFI